MKNSITALIIDPEKYNKNYEKILVADLYNDRTVNIELIVETNTKNLLEVLYANKEVDCIITICDNDEIDFLPLNMLSFEYRKKWIHLFPHKYDNNITNNTLAESIINVYYGNIDRPMPSERLPLFSFFTSAYNTTIKQLDRLYNSLCAQTYHEWNWFVLDDSPDSDLRVVRHLKEYKDPRIHVFRNVTEHGNIGKNKHNVAMLCNGDWLFEIDHDDEIVPHCLERLVDAIKAYPDTDFLYSHAIELNPDGNHIKYEKPFAYGTGTYGKEWTYNGIVYYDVPLTSDINCVSIRGIHACPNHLRCWKKDFYHKINGHNTDFCVLDDMEIIYRTFLYGKMTKVDDILYLQYASAGERTSGSKNGSATVQRFDVIQKVNAMLRSIYDKAVHDRLLELCGEDYIWIDDVSGSRVYVTEDELPKLKTVCNVYDIDSRIVKYE